MTEAGDARKSGPIIIGLVIVADAVLAVDFAVAVAIPMISDAFHVGAGTIQWIIGGYSLTFGSFALLGGRVADMLGDTRCYVVGCALSAFAMLLSAAAPSVALLIAARAVAGAAAAFLLPATLSMLANYFPPGPTQLRVLSIHVAASAIASPLGGLLIGLLIESLGWWTAFVTMFPAITAAGYVAWRHVPAPPLEERAGPRLNPGIALAFAGLIAGLSLSLTSLFTGESMGRGEAALIVVGCLLLLSLLLLTNGRSAFPLVPIRLVARRGFLISLSLSGIMTSAITTNTLLIHLTLQRVAGFTPSQSGLMFVPSGAFALFLGIFVAPRVAARILRHPQASLTLFFAAVAVSAIIMAWPLKPAEAVAIFLPAMFLMNAGLVFGGSVILAQIYRWALPGAQGITSSLIFTCRMLFIASGTSAIISFTTSHGPTRIAGLAVNEYGSGFLLSASTAIGGGVLVFVLRPSPQS